MTLPEPLFCPCCAFFVLHTISQYSSQFLAQPSLLLRWDWLSAAINSEESLEMIASEDTFISPDRASEVV